MADRGGLETEEVVVIGSFCLDAIQAASDGDIVTDDDDGDSEVMEEKKADLALSLDVRG